MNQAVCSVVDSPCSAGRSKRQVDSDLAVGYRVRRASSAVSFLAGHVHIVNTTGDIVYGLI